MSFIFKDLEMTPLGKLRMLCVDMYDQAPMIFACKNTRGKIHIGCCTYMNPSKFVYIYLQATQATFEKLVHREIDLYTFFTKPDYPMLYEVTLSRVLPRVAEFKTIFKIIPASELSDNEKPSRGLYLIVPCFTNIVSQEITDMLSPGGFPAA